MQEARDKVLDEMIQQYGNNKVNAVSDNQSVQIQEIVEDVDKSESAKSEKSKHSQKRQSAWKNLFNFKKKKSEKLHLLVLEWLKEFFLLWHAESDIYNFPISAPRPDRNLILSVMVLQKHPLSYSRIKNFKLFGSY